MPFHPSAIPMASCTLFHPSVAVRMPKRKFDYEAENDDPHAPTDHNPTPMTFKRTRLLREGDSKHTPCTTRDMTELLDFILRHEEAFQNPFRLPSLYADFPQLLLLNPDNYAANTSIWIAALTAASRAGLIPSHGATYDVLGIQASDDLARALTHPKYGMPTCLPAVFHEAVQMGDMMPRSAFLSAKENVNREKSWVPSPWVVLQWGLRQFGVLGRAQPPTRLRTENYVVLKSVEEAAERVLRDMESSISTSTDRVVSRTAFAERFARVMGTEASLTKDDVEVLLVHLARDKGTISYDSKTIKFKSPQDLAPLPITPEDTAIANLRDTLSSINAQLSLLTARIATQDGEVRQAVQANQTARAKSALRLRKLTEVTLAQRSATALQLETLYADLQRAADQIGIVEAMRAGAAALKSLNDKVGGAEGVQSVVDGVNEQIRITDEVSGVIAEGGMQVDEVELDDEVEALERAEREKVDAENRERQSREREKEREEAEGVAARFREVEEADQRRRESEAEAEAARKREDDSERVAEQEQKGIEKSQTEKQIDEASQALAELSVSQPEGLDREKEQRCAPLPA